MCLGFGLFLVTPRAARGWVSVCFGDPGLRAHGACDATALSGRLGRGYLFLCVSPLCSIYRNKGGQKRLSLTVIVRPGRFLLGQTIMV